MPFSIEDKQTPNSPDLNPVDYKIWSLLQERVYKTNIKDIDELRERIVEEWDKLDQRIIDNAVGQWRKRLRACVAADTEAKETSSVCGCRWRTV